MEARAYWDEKARLLDVVVEAYRELRARFDVVICEGAGSPAEINLRSVDIVNLGFARAVGAPVVVVSDIDRGGMFASLVGTVALLDDEDQRLVQGFVVNRFRGDRALLEPGLEMLRGPDGSPDLRRAPLRRGPLGRRGGPSRPVRLPGPRRAGRRATRCGWRSFGCHGRATSPTSTPLPPSPASSSASPRTPRSSPTPTSSCCRALGRRWTIWQWLRAAGARQRLAPAGRRPAARSWGSAVGTRCWVCPIDDHVESGRGTVEGLGLLPVRDRVRRREGPGPPRPDAGRRHDRGGLRDPPRRRAPIGRGQRSSPTKAVESVRWRGRRGTDCSRTTSSVAPFLAEVALAAGRSFVASPDCRFEDIREARFDRLADMVADHVDTAALTRIIEGHRGRYASDPPLAGMRAEASVARLRGPFAEGRRHGTGSHLSRRSPRIVTG